MPSETDTAKRALGKRLRELAARYDVALTLTRDSSNKDVEKAFRKVSFKVHPDKGGVLLDFQRMSAANDAWQNLLKNTGPAGRPRGHGRQPKPGSGKPWAVGVAKEEKVYRVQSQAVLLTYQSFSADIVMFIPVWRRFVVFVEMKQKEWGVKYWTATAETNDDTRHHLHLMLQFATADDARASNLYKFEGARVRQVLHTATARQKAASIAGGFRKVCREVSRKGGAAARS